MTPRRFAYELVGCVAVLAALAFVVIVMGGR